MNNCKQCNTETTNPNFCSRSCAASFNNVVSPKRRPKQEENRCSCGNLIPFPRHRRRKCAECRIEPDYTLKEATIETCARSGAFALVRYRARRLAIQLGWKACVKCGYDKHYEVCHVKPIKDFDDETRLSVINDPSNLLALCPNCHWELDHSSE